MEPQSKIVASKRPAETLFIYTVDVLYYVLVVVQMLKYKGTKETIALFICGSIYHNRLISQKPANMDY